MPIHDWTRVPAGTWHDFHLAWIAALHRVMNCGLLAPDYYAQAEYSTGSVGPDAISSDPVEHGNARDMEGEDEPSLYALKRRTLVIRHVSGDKIIALIELVSPGNKAARFALDSFVEKAVEALYRGYHLLIVDLFPPTPRDPQGIHAAIWSEFSTTRYEPPAGEPLTLAAYSAGSPKRAYVEPTAVGRELIEMPLFLEPEIYINVPLEETYQAAYRGVPLRWKRVLEGGA
ncbi:MAG: DUF4058 family protein [Isosphaeraceae bacterium]